MGRGENRFVFPLRRPMQGSRVVGQVARERERPYLIDRWSAPQRIDKQVLTRTIHKLRSPPFPPLEILDSRQNFHLAIFPAKQCNDL